MQKDFAIIGCGRIGCRHAEQIIRVGNVKAVCDIVPAKADELAALYGATPYYTIESLLLTEKNIRLQLFVLPTACMNAHSMTEFKKFCS